MTIQIRAGTVDGALQYNGTDAVTVTATGVTIPTALTILGLDASGYSADAYAYVGAGGTNASFAMRTARGTSVAPTATQSGDVIGNTDYFGFGTVSSYAASLDCVASGVFTGTSYPVQFNFNLTPVNTIVPVQAASLLSTGVFSLPLAGSSVHVSGVDANSYAFSALAYNAVATGTGVQLGGARGTVAAPTATLSGDTIGNIDFFGYGTSFVEGASLNAIVGSTWTAANAETALTMFVTPVNTIVSVEKMRLASDGSLLVGAVTSPAAAVTGNTTFPTTLTGDVIVAAGGMLSLSTEKAGAYNFTGLGYSAANTNNASIGLKSQTRGAAATSAGDTIGNIDMFGWTGAAYSYAASIDCTAAAAGGAWTTISTPTQFNINLTPVGSVTPIQAMTLVPGGLILLPATGGIMGNIGTTSAVVGQVGEYVTAQVLIGAPAALTSAVLANITVISLTAGDWDVEGIVDYLPAATTNITTLTTGSTTVAGTLGVQDTYVSDFIGGVPGAINYGEIIPKTRLLLTATTNVYLVASANFTVSTCAAAGRIVARRMR